MNNKPEIPGNKSVPEAVIRRLPKYLHYLREIEKRGEERISSAKMSMDLCLTASQIRRDLSFFGGFGQQGYGYTVSKLSAEIEAILGINERHSMVIAGVGNIGQALMLHENFRRKGFDILAAFDASKDRIGINIGNICIQNITEMPEFIRKNNIDMGVICVPGEYAQEITDAMVEAGVKGIWNFTPTDVYSSSSVAIENIHLNDSLYVLSYKMKNRED